MDEIYHDESLGAHVNIALVRLIMVGYRQVSPRGRGQGVVAVGGGWRTSRRVTYQIPLLKESVGKVRSGCGAVMETSPVTVELADSDLCSLKPNAP